MKLKASNKQVTFYMNGDVYKMFQKKYPNVAALFLRRCVVQAIKSPDFFQHVFFEVNENIEVES